MSDQFTDMHIRDLPRNLIADISQQLSWYSTGLIKISQDNRDSETANLIGSGTFVSIEGLHGILTAQHVSALISDSCDIGLTLSASEEKHTIDSKYLKIIEVAKSSNPSEGPDISFIVLPPSDLGTIKVFKSFHNLTQKRKAILNKYPEINLGIWFICGIPDEATRIENSEKGFDYLKAFRGFCGAAPVDRPTMRGDYDCLEVDVKCGKDSEGPVSYGGVSGGGLWQIILIQDKNGVIQPKDHILSGLAFYQSDLINRARFIRCHGRHSIYKVAYDKVVEENS